MTDVRSRSEGLPAGMLLAGAGGFLDAFTFVGYNGVFANAQTGNVVLLGVDDLQTRPWDASDGQVIDRYGLHWLIGFEGDESD